MEFYFSFGVCIGFLSFLFYAIIFVICLGSVWVSIATENDSNFVEWEWIYKVMFARQLFNDEYVDATFPSIIVGLLCIFIVGSMFSLFIGLLWPLVLIFGSAYLVRYIINLMKGF
jgi:hypothetical protein